MNNSEFRKNILIEALKLHKKGIGGYRLVEKPIRTKKEHRKLRPGKAFYKYERSNNRGPALKKLWGELKNKKLYGKPWCGAFVSLSLKRAGGTNKKILSALLSAKRGRKLLDNKNKNIVGFNFRNKKNIKERNIFLSKENVIQPGDVFIRKGHIALVKSYNQKTGELITVEGNTWKGDPIGQTALKRYFLRTDVTNKAHVISAKKRFSKSENPYFLRYIPTNKEKNIKERSIKEGNEEEIKQRNEVEKKQEKPQVYFDKSYQPLENRRDGGVPSTKKSQGRFQGKDAFQVYDILNKQSEIGVGAGSLLKSRGVYDDFFKEQQRLTVLQDEFHSWQNNHLEAYNSPLIKNIAGKLYKSIGVINTRIKNRLITSGITGDSKVKVLFDGKSLVIHQPGKEAIVFHGAVSGNKELKSWFDTSKKAQMAQGKGPIPEGTYWVDLSQISLVKNPLKWVGFGLERLTIHPYKTTQTFGRGGFFIHGGLLFGSAGCIDLPNDISNFFNTLIKAEKNKTLRVRIVIDYTKDLKRWKNEIGVKKEASLDGAEAIKVAQKQLTPQEIKYVNSKLKTAQSYGLKYKFKPEEIKKIEAYFKLKHSKEAEAGKMSEALIWNIALFQKKLNSEGNKVGKVDGILGRKTIPFLEARVGIERAKKQYSLRERTLEGYAQKIIKAPYNTIVESEAKKNAIDPNVIRSIIAIESSGNKMAGRGRGYKGLMQAGTTKDHYKPEVSIPIGTKKYCRFKKRIEGLAKKVGLKISKISPDKLIFLNMLSYNAGPGVPFRSMVFAQKDGDVSKWSEEKYLKKALVYHGSYSPRKTLPKLLRRLDAKTLADELSKLKGWSKEKVKKEFSLPNGVLKKSALKLAIIKSVEAERRELSKECKAGKLGLKEIDKKISKFLKVSLNFKYKNFPKYLKKFKLFHDYFKKNENRINKEINKNSEKKVEHPREKVVSKGLQEEMKERVDKALKLDLPKIKSRGDIKPLDRVKNKKDNTGLNKNSITSSLKSKLKTNKTMENKDKNIKGEVKGGKKEKNTQGQMNDKTSTSDKKNKLKLPKIETQKNKTLKKINRDRAKKEQVIKKKKAVEQKMKREKARINRKT